MAVRLAWEKAGLTLDVEDDGRGFDPAAASTGFGLAGMEERARRLGATLTIRSQVGEGTRI